MNFIVIAVITLLAGGLGTALGRYVWPPKNETDKEAYANAQGEIRRLCEELNGLRARGLSVEEKYEAALHDRKTTAEEIARLSERLANANREIETLKQQNAAVEQQRERAVADAAAAASELARIHERGHELQQKIEFHASRLSALPKELTGEFESIAGRILKANAAELSETSSKSLSAILAPLRQHIQDFEHKVDSTYRAESRDVLALKEQIQLVLETNQAVGTQADALAKALRNDPRALGQWGGLALDRILEAAGLSEGVEFISPEGGSKRANGSAKGAANRAAFASGTVILLPEGRTMVVDATVPLASYERLAAARDDVDAERRGEEFLRQITAHIDELAARREHDDAGPASHECVLMFVPVEGALAAALTRDPGLFLYAWDRRVVLVGPSTLLMTMRTVASIWRYQRQALDAQKIAALASALCDKVSTGVGDLNRVAGSLTDALSSHHDAVERLMPGQVPPPALHVRRPEVMN